MITTFRSGLLADESGSVTIFVAISLIATLGIMGFAIDVGQLRMAKQQLQMTADAAALAGALELSSCGGTANCSVLKAAAQDALTENNLSGSTLLTNCAVGSTTILTVTVNNGPCALGTANPHNGNVSYVEAVVSQPQPTYFAGVLGIRSVLLKARAEATIAASTNCLYTLGTSGTDILMNGSGSFTIQNCGIIDDSSDNQALLLNGSASIAAKSIGIVGNYRHNGGGNGAGITPTPITGIAPVGDPLASLPAPSFAPNSCQASTVINGSGNFSLGPAIPGGTVCYNGLLLNGDPTVTLAPGLYIMNGPFQVNMGGAGSVTGTGVTFYFPPAGSYTDNGSGTLNIAAPTNGTYNGILFYEARGNTQQMTFNGSSSSTVKGIFYLPSASLLMNGSLNSTFYSDIVVSSVLFNGELTLKDYALINSSSPLNSGSVLSQ